MTGRVLVVDDHAINLKLARIVLESAGLAVRVAADGASAASALAEFVPDVVLMDLQLPGDDGFALTRRFKAVCPGLRVVAFTAFAMPGDGDRAREAGCDGHVTKPIEPDALLAAVAAHLPPTG